MSVDLAEIAAPQHTAIVTQELQGAVVGPNAGLAMLAKEAQKQALPNIERLLPAARDAGVRIVHCLVQRSVPAARAPRCFPNSALPLTMSCCTDGMA